MKRVVLLGLMLAVLAPAAAGGAPTTRVGESAQPLNAGTVTAVDLSVPAPTDSFTVAILGDRTGGDDSGLAVLAQAVSEINLLEPDLVLHIGDIVPGYIRDMSQWERDIERVKAILDKLQVPLFPVAGNHDVITGTGNPDDRRGEELHSRHFGPLYYSFDYRYAHFVCLYTEETLQSAPRFSQKQLQWLREDLSRSTARHIFVLMHKPMWEYPDAGWEAVHEILKAHPVRAVIAGHFHHYYKSQHSDGIQYYVIGPTGGQLYAPELAGGLEHYCLLRIDAEGCRLVLVKPGGILPDDYIAGDDFKNMEKLRFLSRQDAGVASLVRSPELGAVDERVVVFVTNPLDVALPVTVRGIARSGWSFSPAVRSLVVEPGGRRYVELGIRSPQMPTAQLVVPEIEIQYTYVDSRERSVPIVLTRRIPLRREVTAPLIKAAIALDGRADEKAWGRAPLLTTARWQVSPYESDEAGPVFRILPTGAGIYFYAESPDGDVSDFRGERMLSDALFVGAMAPAEKVAATDLQKTPVMVIFPFSHPGPGQALRAFWDPREPVGPSAQGVHVVASVLDGETGWRCEGFVPWDMLLSDGAPPDTQLSFNIGAWDNDGKLFTELHSWCPTDDAGQWGRLVLQSPPEE